MSDFSMFGLPNIDETTGLPQVKNVAQAAAPVLIGRFAYGDFAASATYQAVMISVLHRHATQRSFIISNELNEALTSVRFYVFDSTQDTNSNTAGGQSYADSGGIAASGYGQYTSEGGSGAGVLAMHFDSILIEMAMGATAPTSGDVYVYVTELFD
ncbi:MAG: hypothetical protein C7B43_16465 [Sulfobacillus benefaciens]|uniref:Uncharacterized protein n=1 Tax=Sulfobacillus benefaciens TaxID=453960 RepID=A0A2T2WTS2_9FIRM|nr:MAG: hypothetical protein C7B43_16465 [Sulfobacillus benefaciens]